MAETLGEKLRAAREERGVSISEVAEQTRIAPMYIECIENDNYKPLPGGIFNKGFVKSYARFIGFDEHEALQEYSKIASQSDEGRREDLHSYRPEVLTDDRSGPSLLPTIIFAGIILGLLTGGVLFLLNYLQSKPSPPTAVSNASDSNQNSAIPENPTTLSSSGNAPTMANLKVEFRTVSEPISLSATSDGKSSINTVTQTSSQTFEPRESLKLSYAKSLAASAKLFINGKEIVLPTQPANPKRIPIELEINAANIAQIWGAGAIAFDTPELSPTRTPDSVQTATPSPTQPQSPVPSTPNPSTPTPRPSPARTPAANSNTRRPSPTPIVVGNRNPTPRSTPN